MQKAILKATADFFLEIFFPKRCVNCGEFGEYLCFDCVGEIERIQTPACPECGKITMLGQFCKPCKNRIKTALTGLVVSAQYEGAVVEMIHNLKYGGITELAELLGELIYQRVRDRLPSGSIVVVPVPLHCKREARRGFNQAELLARHLSDKLDLRGGLVLNRIKDSEPQAQLSGEKRRQNLVGAFYLGSEDKKFVNKKTVLLVDDVATTLSTLNECAKLLRAAGARQVWGVVAARG